MTVPWPWQTWHGRDETTWPRNVRCTDCTSCTYCFGCVGLSKKDFHILNVGFSRQEYFELTKRLKKELNVR